MTTAVDINLECGGRLDEALCQIAENICDQQRLEDKLDAATASGRHALLLMALFPVGFTAFLYRLDPGGFDAISASTTGQIGIGGSLLIIYLAVRWGMAILDRVGI
jgi:Flp pilus assembly protein TadB